MKSSVLLIAIPLFFQMYCHAQPQIEKTNFRGTISFMELPSRLRETSGLVFFKNMLWTFNDSGGRPKLYAISPADGAIKQTLKIKNGNNFDWEDIAQDDEYIYIGDFGNNFGNRKRLKVFKIPKSGITESKRTKLLAERIFFAYEDQVDFSFGMMETQFDCEAVVAYSDSLILFSKDWKTYTTSIYAIPKIPGKHIANKTSTLPIQGLITGAEMIEQEQAVALVGRHSSPFILILRFSTENHFIAGRGTQIDLNFLKGAQIEGIAYNNGTFYLSVEESRYSQRIFKIQGINLE